jgi:hypothetical protein
MTTDLLNADGQSRTRHAGKFGIRRTPHEHVCDADCGGPHGLVTVYTWQCPGGGLIHDPDSCMTHHPETVEVCSLCGASRP